MIACFFNAFGNHFYRSSELVAESEVDVSFFGERIGNFDLVRCRIRRNGDRKGFSFLFLHCAEVAIATPDTFAICAKICGAVGRECHGCWVYSVRQTGISARPMIRVIWADDDSVGKQSACDKCSYAAIWRGEESVNIG